MKIAKTTERLEVEGADISGSIFHDVNFSGANFDDVNMSGWRINNVNLAGLHITNANLAGAAISASRLGGMTIDGIPVTELLAAYAAAHPSETGLPTPEGRR